MATNKGLPRSTADIRKRLGALASITAPDATDEASAVTLANATKETVNAIIAALKG